MKVKAKKFSFLSCDYKPKSLKTEKLNNWYDFVKNSTPYSACSHYGNHLVTAFIRLSIAVY